MTKNSELVSGLSSRNADVRQATLARVVDTRFGRHQPFSREEEAALLELAQSETDRSICLTLLSGLGERFEWFLSSPVGPIHVELCDQLMSAVPGVVARFPKDRELVLLAGKALGRLGTLSGLEAVGTELLGDGEFLEAVVDGIYQRELEESTRDLLRFLLASEVDGISASAANALTELEKS